MGAATQISEEGWQCPAGSLGQHAVWVYEDKTDYRPQDVGG